MDAMRRKYHLGRFLVLVGLALAGVGASASDGLAPLRRGLPRAKRTQVMILGTFHHREIKEGFQPRLLDGLLDRLAGFRPDAVAVEALPGEEVRKLAREMEATPVHQEVGKTFASMALGLGGEAQKVLGIDALEAARQWAQRPLDSGPRGVLVALAAYEWPTALLAWSKLPPESRGGPPEIPKELGDRLDRQLGRVGEIQTLALPLAKRLGLARIDAVDAFENYWAIGPVIEALQAARKTDPRFATAGQAAVYRRSKEQLAAAIRQGDLLPAYRLFNSARYGAEDVAAQWGVFLRTGLPGGEDRARLALWEERNMKIAANIRALSARHPGGRILVIYGAAHKPFLEAQLSHCSDLVLVQPSGLLRGGRR